VLLETVTGWLGAPRWAGSGGWLNSGAGHSQVSCDIGELCAHVLAWTVADLSGRPAPGADEVAAALALRNGAPLSGSLAPKPRLAPQAEVEQAAM